MRPLKIAHVVLAIAMAILAAVVLVVGTVLSERASYAESRQERLNVIAKRVRVYRDATGRWPDRFAVMAPPECVGGGCVLLTADLAQSFEPTHRLQPTNEGVQVCYRDQCAAAR